MGVRVPVDIALVLAMDCSGSISTDHLALQFQGYVQALTSNSFVTAVKSGPHGQIAVTFVEWSSAGRQSQTVPWTRIDGINAARGFVAAFAAAPSPTPGFTSISGAIDFSVQLLSRSGFATPRRVIDISGDGANNDGRSLAESRAAAIAAGVTINGLPILGDEPDIDHYYAQKVIGGPAAFIEPATDLDSFSRAIQRKLATEIATAQTLFNARALA